MKNREVLKDLAFDVNDLLSLYIIVHDKRLKKAGTLKSFLNNLLFNKKVDFKEILEETEEILEKFDQKRNKFKLVSNTLYKGFNDQEKAFFDCLTEYFEALFNTCVALNKLAEYQHSISLSAKNASWSKNQELENNYKSAIKEYYSLGEKLNTLYQNMSKA